MKRMHWVSVEDRLPEDGQAVLVRYGGDNWLSDHKLADGSLHKQWRWQAARFVRGRTAEQLARENTISVADQHGNNLVPYCWDQFGPGRLFGQDVTHWAAITDPAANSLLAKPATKSCTWIEDADGNWHTGCQQIYVIISGTPDENGYVYCPYCGGGVQIRMTSLEICDQKEGGK